MTGDRSWGPVQPVDRPALAAAGFSAMKELAMHSAAHASPASAGDSPVTSNDSLALNIVSDAQLAELSAAVAAHDSAAAAGAASSALPAAAESPGPAEQTGWSTGSADAAATTPASAQGKSDIAAANGATRNSTALQDLSAALDTSASGSSDMTAAADAAVSTAVRDSTELQELSAALRGAAPSGDSAAAPWQEMDARSTADITGQADAPGGNTDLQNAQASAQRAHDVAVASDAAASAVAGDSTELLNLSAAFTPAVSGAAAEITTPVQGMGADDSRSGKQSSEVQAGALEQNSVHDTAAAEVNDTEDALDIAAAADTAASVATSDVTESQAAAAALDESSAADAAAAAPAAPAQDLAAAIASAETNSDMAATAEAAANRAEGGSTELRGVLVDESAAPDAATAATQGQELSDSDSEPAPALDNQQDHAAEQEAMHDMEAASAFGSLLDAADHAPFTDGAQQAAEQAMQWFVSTSESSVDSGAENSDVASSGTTIQESRPSLEELVDVLSQKKLDSFGRPAHGAARSSSGSSTRHAAAADAFGWLSGNDFAAPPDEVVAKAASWFKAANSDSAVNEAGGSMTEPHLLDALAAAQEAASPEEADAILLQALHSPTDSAPTAAKPPEERLSDAAALTESDSSAEDEAFAPDLSPQAEAARSQHGPKGKAATSADAKCDLAAADAFDILAGASFAPPNPKVAAQAASWFADSRAHAAADLLAQVQQASNAADADAALLQALAAAKRQRAGLLQAATDVTKDATPGRAHVDEDAGADTAAEAGSPGGAVPAESVQPSQKQQGAALHAVVSMQSPGMCLPRSVGLSPAVQHIIDTRQRLQACRTLYSFQCTRTCSKLAGCSSPQLAVYRRGQSSAARKRGSR